MHGNDQGINTDMREFAVLKRECKRRRVQEHAGRHMSVSFHIRKPTGDCGRRRGECVAPISGSSDA